MTIQEWFRDGVQYDSEGTQIWAEERTKDAVYLHHVADIRGWGEMQNLFKLDMNKAAAFQDEVGKFVAEAINEKLAKQKLNIHGVMQAEGSDGVEGAAVASGAVGSQTSALTCANGCDWPNCTLEGCVDPKCDC